MKPLLTIVFFTLLVSESFAQWTFNVFELYKKDAELTVGFNNRRTHINNEFGTIYGFKIGLNFDRRLKNTFIFSSTLFDLGKPPVPGLAYSTAQLNFASIAEEFTFYQKNNLSFSTYFTAGYGFNVFKAHNGGLLLTEKRRILPLEFGLQTSYLLFTWLDVKAGAGWRYFVIGNDNGLSGYFFQLGAGIKYKAFRKAMSK